MIMKKIVYALISLAAVLSFASCEKDKYGTVAGNDSEPYVLINPVTPSLPYDPDCDIMIRLAANNATTDVYYFAETKAQKAGRNLSDDAYADYVVANGKKVTLATNEFDGAGNCDIVLQSLFGENVISAVAVSGDKKYLATESFTGLKWNTITSGEYYFCKSSISSRAGGNNKVVELQQLDTDHDCYRFKNLFASGKHLVFQLWGDADGYYTGTDPDLGDYIMARVSPQGTGLTYGSYGSISVRDYGYYKNDDSVADVELYADNMVYLLLQYYVSAGSLGYGWDHFFPSK